MPKTSPRRVGKQEGQAESSLELFLMCVMAWFELPTMRGGAVDDEPVAGAIWCMGDVQKWYGMFLGDLQAWEG